AHRRAARRRDAPGRRRDGCRRNRAALDGSTTDNAGPGGGRGAQVARAPAVTRRLAAAVLTLLAAALATGPSGRPAAAPRVAPAIVVAPPDALPAPPTRVRIPTIGVNSALQALHLDGHGALAPPTDYATAGWYADGTAPGDVGPAVIAGH